MPRYAAWLKALPGKLVFVGYPVVFDYMFVQWYLHKFRATYATTCLRRGADVKMVQGWLGHSGKDFSSTSRYLAAAEREDDQAVVLGPQELERGYGAAASDQRHRSEPRPSRRQLRCHKSSITLS